MGFRVTVHGRDGRTAVLCDRRMSELYPELTEALHNLGYEKVPSLQDMYAICSAPSYHGKRLREWASVLEIEKWNAQQIKRIVV